MHDSCDTFMQNKIHRYFFVLLFTLIYPCHSGSTVFRKNPRDGSKQHNHMIEEIYYYKWSCYNFVNQWKLET